MNSVNLKACFKFIVLYALITVVKCGFIGSPIVHYASAPAIVKKIEVQAPPQYAFQYSINDALTGDVKNQHETRNGDDVTGSYSLIDADGTKRTVEYTASEAGGFNAVVRREGTPAPAPVVIKKVIAAPTITKIIAPAPVVHKVAPISGYSFQHSTPLFSYSW